MEKEKPKKKKLNKDEFRRGEHLSFSDILNLMKRSNYKRLKDNLR
ncbi:hypothetical protein AB8U03_12770 [Clostridium sp. Mt-5]|uniref:Uncharacterized protein n=1 Tax=Clostridium moutaii TaxID=3240932 RepID=A0ABV4BU53_9CLOT